MNARKLRRTRRWARYINHYAHIPNVIIGGDGAVLAMCAYGLRNATYYCVRRQQKHRFAKGYSLP